MLSASKWARYCPLKQQKAAAIMTGISSLDVFSIDLDCDHDDDIGPGDLVRAASTLFPHFWVIAVYDDMAWLRDVQSGDGYLVPLRRCRRLDTPALAMAAE